MTLGLCYEKKGNFAGGAYSPILRRLETFSGDSLKKAIAVHEKHAGDGLRARRAGRGGRGRS